MSQLRTFTPNSPLQRRWHKVRNPQFDVSTSLVTLPIKFDQLCSLRSKKLLKPPLYKNKQCEQKLTLSVAFTWTQTLITGMK